MTVPDAVQNPPAGPPLKPTLRHVLAAAEHPLVGLWSSSGSTVDAEILAASGADLIIIDGEHGPVDLPSVLHLLQTLEAYPVTTLVRVPWNDPVRIKQILDLGAQNILVPMVSSAQDAERAVAAARYPGASGQERAGRRGIGSALARSARWGRVPGYVQSADDHVSVVVQIETAEAVEAASAIAATEGVDAVFIGPADLAGSLGHAGSPSDPAVVSAVDSAIAAARAQQVPVGVNAFAHADAQRVLEAGARFVVVSADVTLLAGASRSAVQAARAHRPSARRPSVRRRLTEEE